MLWAAESKGENGRKQADLSKTSALLANFADSRSFRREMKGEFSVTGAFGENTGAFGRNTGAFAKFTGADPKSGSSPTPTTKNRLGNRSFPACLA